MGEFLSVNLKDNYCFLSTQDIYLPKVVCGHFKIALELWVAPAKKNVIGAIISRMADWIERVNI